MSLKVIEHSKITDGSISIQPGASGAYTVPENAQLFSGHFERAGPDLYIHFDGAPSLHFPEYFSNQTLADIQNPEGAVLRGKHVDLLAGTATPAQYAQAGGSVGANPIGQVEVLEGSASVQRVDGTVEPLQIGMKIFQQDVVQTDDAGTLSITFADGTIFTLAASSRMIIDELIYDPDASDNSGGFSLVQGSFVFIAGQVAKTGGMEVSTPSSTMGIRGTTVVVQIVSENGVISSEMTLTNDPSGETGIVQLFDTAGNLVAEITETDTKWVMSSSGEVVRELERTAQDELEDSILIAEAFAAFRAAITRFDAGDTFVTLSDPIVTAPTQGAGGDVGTDLEVDNIDDADTIDQLEEVPDELEGEEFAPFDEGFITIEEVAPPALIVVSGDEDSSADDPIAGVIETPFGEGVTVVYSLATAPDSGTATVNPDGTFFFVPDADFNGSDGFTYTAAAADGSETEGAIRVDVLPVNDAPTAEDIAATMPEDSIGSGGIIADDVDGDLLSFSVLDLPSNGEVILLSNGNFTYTPNEDFEGVDSFSVLVSDPFGEAATSNVEIEVEGTNDDPVLISSASDTSGSVTEGEEEYTVIGELVAVDPDIGDTFTWSGVAAAAYGGFALSETGEWMYTLDNVLADSLVEGETVVETLTATATDESGGTLNQIVEVTVTGSNDRPIVSINTNFETVEAVEVAGALTATDVDSPDAALTFAVGDLVPENGTLFLNPDGSFTYTPNEGFVGLERFNYTVTDDLGEVSSGGVTVAVESDPDDPVSEVVSVGLSIEATPETAAGAVTIDIDAAEPVSVNLAIALDRSGSIGLVDWTELLESTQEAVSVLADLFEGSDTSVDVKIITFAGDVDVSRTYDLNEEALLGDLTPSVFTYRGGATSWALAFEEAGKFFFSESSDEANFLIFVTDGVPTLGSFEPPLAELQDPTDDYDVTISAFGFGDDFAEGSLDPVDPGAGLFTSPDELADALKTTPIFNPELISFTITLQADGGDIVEIADETSPALIVEGTDYELPLASIESIIDLLGESNRVYIDARFDLDNDKSTSEINFFSSDIIGKNASAQTKSGFDGNDLIFGSDESDSLSGAGGDDILISFDGADTLDGGVGEDTIRAGSGDDRLIVSDAATLGDDLDGGSGRDVLALEAIGDINAMLEDLTLNDIEALDITNANDDALQLTYADILSISDNEDPDLMDLPGVAGDQTMTIYGDDTDTLQLDGSGLYNITETGATEDSSGVPLTLYQFTDSGGNALATLGVDTDVAVEISNVPVA